ncbi:hypothetical protein WA026_008832 [Henosepilachna vigintioctopunctata]|uniref:Uncharacterized protein n=1 Tax=Henosepilachna vigintioctopunctata TaxID=420089 RepID=A0AAW1V8V3_9CUCU
MAKVKNTSMVHQAGITTAEYFVHASYNWIVTSGVTSLTAPQYYQFFTLPPGLRPLKDCAPMHRIGCIGIIYATGCNSVEAHHSTNNIAKKLREISLNIFKEL